MVGDLDPIQILYFNCSQRTYFQFDRCALVSSMVVPRADGVLSSACCGTSCGVASEPFSSSETLRGCEETQCSVKSYVL